MPGIQQHIQTRSTQAVVGKELMLDIDATGWDLLIIDDEPDNIGVLTYVLSFHNIPYRTAEDGETGLNLIRQRRPSALLLDIAMPKLSGWDVIKIIRGDPELKDLVVIAFTAHTMAGDREKSLAAGFDGYIAKPINILTVLDEIDQVVQARKTQAAAPLPVAADKPVESAPVLPPRPAESAPATPATSPTPGTLVNDAKPSVAGDKPVEGFSAKPITGTEMS